MNRLKSVTFLILLFYSFSPLNSQSFSLTVMLHLHFFASLDKSSLMSVVQNFLEEVEELNNQVSIWECLEYAVGGLNCRFLVFDIILFFTVLSIQVLLFFPLITLAVSYSLLSPVNFITLPFEVK